MASLSSLRPAGLSRGPTRKNGTQDVRHIHHSAINTGFVCCVRCFMLEHDAASNYFELSIVHFASFVFHVAFPFVVRTIPQPTRQACMPSCSVPPCGASLPTLRISADK